MAEETQTIAYTLPDGSYYQLRNLPWAVVGEIETRHHTSWIMVIDMPHANGMVLVDLLRAIHAINGLPEPTIGIVVDLIELASRFVTLDLATGLPVIAPDDAGALAPVAWSPPAG